MKIVFNISDHNCMTSIVPSLDISIAVSPIRLYLASGNNVNIVTKHINKFPLSLIAPLRSYYNIVSIVAKYRGTTDDSYASGGQLSCSVVHDKARILRNEGVNKLNFLTAQLKAAIGAAAARVRVHIPRGCRIGGQEASDVT